MLKFSVIVPIYNVGKYLKQCIDSIINQTYSYFELILVDDGSTDNSPLICDEYAKKDNRIKVIHKNNGGVSAARQDGINICTGDYIICIDGDDWVSEHCFKKASNIINKFNVDVVSFGFIYDSNEKYIKSELNERFGFYNRDEMVKEIFPHLIQSADGKYFSPSLCGKVIKKELLIKYILSNKLATIGEDGACAIPCIYNADNIYIDKECYYYYRYNFNSATKSKRAFNWEYPLIINEHIQKNVNMKFLDFKSQIYRKMTHDVFNVVVSRFYNNCSYRETVKEINENIKKYKYDNYINHSNFKGSAEFILMETALKRKWYFLCYLYSVLKRR